ncbi:MFS transporter [Arthrobacter sp. A5]|uniref:MFS transporter n=1 Tax=Arthrobacter sp. A5 TaxID=576926 RepID=UPI003DA9D0C6
MNFAGYRELLSIAPVRRLLLVAMLARIPHAAAGVLVTLHVVETLNLGYGAAGGVAAAVTIGIALGAPWRGRRVDLVGLRRALVPSVISEVVVWSVAPFLGYELLLVAAVIGGLFSVPIFSVVRQALGVMVAPAQRRTAYALDSVGAELTFMVGPALGVLLSTTLHSVAGLILIGAASAVAGLFLMWFNPPTRTGQRGSYQQDVNDELASMEELSPAEAAGSQSFAGANVLGRLWGRTKGSLVWLNVAVIAVLGASLGAGLVLSGTDVGIVAVLRNSDQIGSMGIVLVFWCAASVVGGLIYGALSRPVNPLWMLAAMALLTIPMGFATDAWSLALLSIAPGLLCAPVLTSSAERIAELVAEQRRGEAMGWYGSSLTLGSAIGAPFGGMMIDIVGPWGGFTTVGILAAALALAGLVAQAFRRRSLSRPALT